ncbi:Ribosomal RNA small subunit methyltransferase J [Arsenophonus endosymbiont of Aleurodicus floccissimus]|uniref:16S rRNA (guanine(1516)-N(2))-methyltransferase RsmJ n=1 Tax=Arsenophonus endosymbiont of Aleurodicus floccissimus TaxID=2152761 RepID=UPI000E6B4552|nr:16S rRNA (guanine(1516)-N(2))-methyltransferase RsmJ [Arsenophonus endosymbiont of Aleurodicus floccissimus]SPP32545.1 Ribosomal RNA small subunit methyltransferase J [Arsenophonus endosymbiont of Aleurodicus floccissimus]
MAIDIQLICKPGASQSALSLIANKWQLKHTPAALMALVLTPQYLQLKKLDEPKLGGIYVDFVSGAMKHRRKFGGGRNEAIAKAVGIKKSYLPTIVDATAGLGRDAFVLAALGCEVRLYERHAAVAALLDDGLQRAYAHAEIGSWLRQRMTLLHASSIDALTTMSPAPDVVYLDPMYPHRQKSALVKKEMRVFQSLVGNDDDADNLLIPAITIAKRRVVVKRSNYASPLAAISPQATIKTKNHRFDIYSFSTDSLR